MLQTTTTKGGRAGQLARRTQSEPRARPQKLVNGLGWFSIGLGLAQVLAPRGVARWIGLTPDARTARTMVGIGLRELASGVGILTSGNGAPWLWMRVGGDVMDLALLGSATRSHKRLDSSRNLTAAIGLLSGALVIDAFAAEQNTRRLHPRLDGTAQPHVREVEVITINRPPEEVYAFWRKFENLPLFMLHLHSVEVQSERRSHWKVKGPAGISFEWDAEIVEDLPNRSISWRSLENADVQSFGSVRFSPAPGGRGTEIRVRMQYDAPGGRLGALIAKLFGKEPGQQAKSDLRRLKQVLETGEVVHSDASIHRGMHPAQPEVGARSLIHSAQEVSP